MLRIITILKEKFYRKFNKPQTSVLKQFYNQIWILQLPYSVSFQKLEYNYA